VADATCTAGKELWVGKSRDERCGAVVRCGAVRCGVVCDELYSGAVPCGRAAVMRHRAAREANDDDLLDLLDLLSLLDLDDLLDHLDLLDLLDLLDVIAVQDALAFMSSLFSC